LVFFFFGDGELFRKTDEEIPDFSYMYHFSCWNTFRGIGHTSLSCTTEKRFILSHLFNFLQM